MFGGDCCLVAMGVLLLGLVEVTLSVVEVLFLLLEFLLLGHQLMFHLSEELHLVYFLFGGLEQLALEHHVVVVEGLLVLYEVAGVLSEHHHLSVLFLDQLYLVLDLVVLLFYNDFEVMALFGDLAGEVLLVGVVLLQFGHGLVLLVHLVLLHVSLLLQPGDLLLLLLELSSEVLHYFMVMVLVLEFSQFRVSRVEELFEVVVLGQEGGVDVEYVSKGGGVFGIVGFELSLQLHDNRI